MSRTDNISPLMRLMFSIHHFIETVLIKFKTQTIIASILICIAYLIQQHYQTHEQQQAILNAPLQHDVWILNMGHFQAQRKYQAQYRVVQVLSVNEEHVELLQGNFTYRKLRGAERAIKLDSLMLDSYFRTQTLKLQRNKLADHFAQQAIVDVYRPNDIYVLGGIVKRRAIPSAINSNIRTKVALNPHNNDAIALFRQGDLPEARAQFLLAAQQGDSWGQYNLAGMLENGQGGEQDLSQAIHWLRQSAQQQNPKAKFALKQLCQIHTQLCEIDPMRSH